MASVIRYETATPAPRSARASGRAASLLRRVAQAFAARRARRELGRLSDGMLADLGLTRGDVESVLAAPFWQPLNVGRLDEARRLRRTRDAWGSDPCTG